MIWHDNNGIGVTQSGFYTIRRCTYDYELWYKNGHNNDFKLLGRAKTLVDGKLDCERHAKHDTAR